MLSSKGFLFYLLLVVILLITAEGKKNCKKKITILQSGSTTSLKSPGFSEIKPKLPCKKQTFEYRSPHGFELTLTCLHMNIKCNNDQSYLWDSVDEKKRCGTAAFSVTSATNKLKVTYFSSNKNKNQKPFQFDCKIEVADICSKCGNRKVATVTLAQRKRSTDQTKIVGGEDALRKEFPYQAYFKKAIGTFICGGSLVTDQWVITAAHCEVKSGYRVVLGAHDLNKRKAYEQNMIVDMIIAHPGYNSNINDRYDIAVVKLTASVKFSDYVQPICLPDPFQNTDFEGISLEATGWGALSYNSPTTDILQKVTLPVISNTACEAAGSSYTGNVFKDNICTLVANKDTCQGDSGGPLAYHTAGKSFLIGATSYGEGCAFQNKPGVFTRVSDPQILQWVKTNIGVTCSATT